MAFFRKSIRNLPGAGFLVQYNSYTYVMSQHEHIFPYLCIDIYTLIYV